MKALLIGAIRAYKRVVSPMLPHACRFVPTCSEYAQEALERHGVLRGTMLAAWRILRCNPFGRAGLDPVPPLKRIDKHDFANGAEACACSTTK